MKFRLARWQKGVLVAFAVLGLVFYILLPWAIEWYIESHDEELIGRQIQVEDIDFNILTGGLSVDQLVIFESDKRTAFVRADLIYINLELWSIVFGNYAIGDLTVQQPEIRIAQRGTTFNFNDLLTRFASADSVTPIQAPVEPVKYRLENLDIANGTFTYINQDVNAELKIVQWNTACPLISSADPREAYQFDFRFDQGGKAHGNFLFDLNTLDYRTDYELDSMNIGIFYPYIADVARFGSLTGLFTSHQVIGGNFGRPTDLSTSGTLQIGSFSLTGNKADKLVGVDQVNVKIDSVNMGQGIYDFRYVQALKPFLKVELYDEGNNFSRLMKEPAPEETGLSSDSLAKAAAYGNVFALMAAYVREMSQLYAFSDYNADSLVLRNGTLIFNDFTLHNRFNYLLENLMVKADKVSSSDAAITVVATSVLNTSGRLSGELKVDPHGFNDMTINYSITGLRVSDFNPYSDYYVAHPFTDGVCTYVSKSTIRNQYLKSDHALDIKTIKVGKKVKNNTAYNVPIRLAVALLRDKNGDVHLELPIEGDLNDPKYRVGKVIWQVFRNLISKAVASPGKLLAGKAGVEEKLLEGFDWTPLQAELAETQVQSLDALAKSLETTPEMKVEIIRMFNTPMETDELAVREGKKKFLFFHRRIRTEDTMQPEELAQVDQVSHNDSTFNAYLNQQVNTDGELVSTYEKSKRLAGPEKLRRNLAQIYDARTAAVLNYLTTVKGISAERVSVIDPTTGNSMAYATLSRMNFRFYVEE